MQELNRTTLQPVIKKAAPAESEVSNVKLAANVAERVERSVAAVSISMMDANDILQKIDEKTQSSSFLSSNKRVNLGQRKSMYSLPKISIERNIERRKVEKLRLPSLSTDSARSSYLAP